MEPLPAGIEPPVRDDERGRPRTVGVEIELTGLDVGEISATVARFAGGRVARETDYLAHVRSRLGDFVIEADLQLLQRIGRSRAAGKEPLVIAAFVDAVAVMAEKIAPFEVATPPLPWQMLPELDDLAAALGHAGGRGSDAGPLMALGLQLNPRVPRPTSACIHAHLRAYALLEPWLRLRRGVDLVRRLTRFVDPYPIRYVELLVDQRQAPDLEQLIDDYLHHNPTRNRSLDMLPLFAHLDGPAVARTVADPRVKSRPTFHYRLPDSRIGHHGRLVTDEWRHWLVVERVAAQPDLLDALARAYRAHALDDAGMAWPEQCEALLAIADYGAAGGAAEAQPLARW